MSCLQHNGVNILSICPFYRTYNSAVKNHSSKSTLVILFPSFNWQPFMLFQLFTIQCIFNSRSYLEISSVSPEKNTMVDSIQKLCFQRNILFSILIFFLNLAYQGKDRPFSNLCVMYC